MTFPLYLDAASTAPPFPEALEACRRAQAESWGDPGGTGPASERAREVLERSRLSVAALLDADPRGVVFTSGGTEADNLALKGLASVAGRRGLLLSAIEPYAVDHPARTLERQGWTLRRIGVDRRGRVLGADVPEGTALVSVVLAHPGIGTWQDLAPLAAAAHAREALLHTDASFAAGFGKVSMRETSADALSLSGHRLGGVAGAGALVLRPGLSLRPLIEGGTQEGGLRPGVPALGAIAAMGAAAGILMRDREAREDRLRKLGRILAEGLERISGSVPTGDPERRIPGHASACLEGLDGEALVTSLAAEGVAASSGAPCAAAGKADPALLATGTSQRLARGSLRLSAWADPPEADAERALEVLERCVRRLRDLAPRSAGAPG